MRLGISLAAWVILLAAPQAMAAGFDCSKAGTAIEKAICADPKLSELDEYLGRYYAVALDTLPDAATCLKADQRDWVKSKRNPCGTKNECLTKTYLDRLGTLDGLQPGASAIKNIELPVAASLVTVIPPEPEGMKSKSKAPFVLEGKLRHENADLYNMGYAVEPKGGTARAFLFDADIGNSPSHETVRLLVETEQQSRFRVAGLTASTGGYADGECRFVYRLPK